MKVSREKLEEILRQAASDDLKTLESSSLQLYAVDIEDGFKSEFRKAIKTKYAVVKDSLNTDERSMFLDIENGYLAQMINWIESHSMSIPSVPCPIFTAEPEISDITELRSFVKSREALFIGGATICLIISGFKIWAWVAEALAVAWGVYKINDTKERKKQQDEFRTKELEKCVNNYIASVKEAAYQWIEEGEAFSEQIIKRYN